jgi:hypothetical protein
MLGGRRRLPIGIGTRFFRNIRCGHARLSQGASGVGTRRAPRGVHVADLIALVNNRLSPRLSLRRCAYCPLAGSAIANIVIDSEILPIGANVAPVITEVAAVISRFDAVGAKILPVRANIGAVAFDVALVLRAITLLRTAIVAA